MFDTALFKRQTMKELKGNKHYLFMELLRLLLLVVEAMFAPRAPAPAPSEAPMPVHVKRCQIKCKVSRKWAFLHDFTISTRKSLHENQFENCTGNAAHLPAGRVPCAKGCFSHPPPAPIIRICLIAHSQVCALSLWGAEIGGAQTNQAVGGINKKI